MPITISSPLIHAAATADASSNIVVTIDNPDSDMCFATIFDYNPSAGTGLGASHGSVRLTAVSAGSRTYRATVNVGTVPAPTPQQTDNKFVQVENQDEGTLTGISFRAVAAGSGSNSHQMFVKSSSQRCANCSLDRPVPVALRLQFDTKVAAGTCADCARLNQPTTLRHANDAKLVCCWLSEPINFCADGANPGRWLLEKTDVTTWNLSLQRGNIVVVTYALRTKAEKDCSFPIQLHRVGKAGKECKKWPKTVTIVPGP